MIKSDCINCKTHFEQGSKLPLQGISIQHKLYPVPIKDKQHKWKLLRTICSFLNSKGGTIFIGVEDSQGEVKGVQIDRKEQDEFKIFVHQLTEKIRPAVDLSNREDIYVQFVPVLSKGKFTGKYVIKIIVNQGEPSQLYCVSKRITLQSVNQRQKQEYQIVYSFMRINAGCIKQYKGYELVQLVKARASKPPNNCVCFHENCNPQPPNLSLQILKIGFSQIYLRQTRQILQQWCESYLRQLKIQDEVISFDNQNKMIVIQFQKRGQFQKVEGFVTKNINQVNKALFGQCNFVKKGTFLDCIVFENTQKSPQIKTSVKKQEVQREKKPKYVKKQKKVMKQQSQQNQSQQQTKIEKLPKSNNFKKQEQKKQQTQKSSERKQYHQSQKRQKNIKNQQQIKIKKQTKQSSQKNDKKQRFKKRHSLTFTHINPKTKEDLVAFLDNLLDCKKVFERHQNTIEVFLPDQQNQEEFYMRAIQYSDDISNYGFKNQIRFGMNIGCLDICNFDNQKGKPNQLKSYIKNILGKQPNQIQIIKNGNRHILRISLSKHSACVWLDRLLKDQQLKTFSIPGAQKNQKPKIKVYLVVIDPIGQLQMDQLLMF